MFCSKCGHQIDDNAEFCKNCGCKIKQTQTIDVEKSYKQLGKEIPQNIRGLKNE